MNDILKIIKEKNFYNSGIYFGIQAIGYIHCYIILGIPKDIYKISENIKIISDLSQISPLPDNIEDYSFILVPKIFLYNKSTDKFLNENDLNDFIRKNIKHA